jgi:hypothetical protein
VHVQNTISIWLWSNTVPAKIQGAILHQVLWENETSTMEHITRFIIQCGEVGNINALRIHVFSSSLSGSAFSWFTSLPANSIIKWSNLE